MIRSLGNYLLPALKSASEFYVAVALMKDYGLRAMEESLPKGCHRVYLVGVDLPTSPSVFRELLILQTNNPHLVFSRVWKQKLNYHPKVYIIKTTDGEWIAFIGSANATRGGFERNIEMSLKIVDQTKCEDLFAWFTENFRLGEKFDKPFIDDYEKTYRRNRQLQSTQKSNTDSLLHRAIPVPGNDLIVPTGQFFRQSDFDAFAPATHYDTSPAAVNARAAVRERLIELNDMIRLRFASFGIYNLNNHPARVSITSQHFHSRGNTHIPKEAIWLHYGKSDAELTTYPNYEFTQHLRIQVILRNTANNAYVGIWLYVAKHNGSYHDRQYLQAHLLDPGFLENLFHHLTDLGNAYWIEINGHELNIQDMLTVTDLETFIRLDNFNGEFNIARIYQPDDPDLSEENIADTVLEEFAKLYKIYDLIKDR